MSDLRETPARTRAEDLHARRFNNGKWSTENLDPMFNYEPSIETLLACISTEEARLPELETAATKASAKAARARSEAANKAAALCRARDDLDIYKIMLAELMEIPR